MVKVINGYKWDTDESVFLFSNGNCLYGYEAYYYTDWCDNYYVTVDGKFFKEFWGGANSRYAVKKNGYSREGYGIVPLEKRDVIDAFSDDSYDIDLVSLAIYLS